MENRSNCHDTDRLVQELKALSELTVKQLKDRWRSLYSSEPPSRISRELLTRVIAYRLQEHAFGGLKPSTQRLLERIADSSSSSGLMRMWSRQKPGAGTVLIREWRGTSHRVSVLDDGVIYRGKRYRSLSDAAPTRVIGVIAITFPAVSSGIRPIRIRRDGVWPPR